jgi:hypothetical protein
LYSFNGTIFAYSLLGKEAIRSSAEKLMIKICEFNVPGLLI